MLNLNMTEQERALADDFIATLKKDYPNYTPSDEYLLNLAGVQYVRYMRMVQNEERTGKQTLSSRFDPLQQLRGLLEDLAMRRKDRIAKEKPADGDEERELREYFLSLSEQPMKVKARGNGNE